MSEQSSAYDDREPRTLRLSALTLPLDATQFGVTFNSLSSFFSLPHPRRIESRARSPPDFTHTRRPRLSKTLEKQPDGVCVRVYARSEMNARMKAREKRLRFSITAAAADRYIYRWCIQYGRDRCNTRGGGEPSVQQRMVCTFRGRDEDGIWNFVRAYVYRVSERKRGRELALQTWVAHWCRDVAGDKNEVHGLQRYFKDIQSCFALLDHYFAYITGD